MKLIIGNKNYSSWSLRPWLLMTAHNVPFEEVCIPLYTPQTKARIRDYHEAGKVPVLLDGHTRVWDSLAICEYISERYLDNRGWPDDPLLRAEARACSCEMHSGFFELRERMPMNCRAQDRLVDRDPALDEEIARIDSMWCGLRARFESQGPWLFGQFSIVDCMYAPVAVRFNTYQVALSESAQAYQNTVLGHPAVQDWMAQALQESAVIVDAEVGQ
ncbi:glutathione S-transferase family protein [Aestuariibacter halophilus]|uniref:Glutathione S-transferase family protein n=1 Tax=Fluctibacter halophilus TaxID=226011 RepID=A0ABS8G9W0_9ALTE|nr:glutathione S-transferase family protein [Aestuariibacter halophilus]MCC2616976.1 glutathione S-transferase family protein [Aestuariibacter halophilus]